VLQTYSNGEIVRWIDPNAPGSAEPEHPMAVLTLVPGGPGDPAWIVAIVAGVVAAGGAAGLWLRSRRSSS
jgi:hypothetical protein